MPIQWFPGHMAKAKRVVQENLKLVDVVIEVVDARCPSASSNDDLVQLLGSKRRIVLLNKADLADPVQTEVWLAHLRSQGAEAAAFDAVHGAAWDLLQMIRRAYAPVLEAIRAKGRLPRPARVMVVGIPNVGKSSVINRLVGTRRAAIGDRPGITKGKQWVRVGADVELLDLPGILPPKFDDQDEAVMLAAIGTIKEDLFDHVEIAGDLLAVLHEKVPHGLKDRLGIEKLAADTANNLAQAAQARGLLRPGGVPDLARAATLVLREAREGRLGRLTLQEPSVTQ